MSSNRQTKEETDRSLGISDAIALLRKQANELSEWRSGERALVHPTVSERLSKQAVQIADLQQRLDAEGIKFDGRAAVLLAQIAELRNDLARTASRYGMLQHAFEKATPAEFKSAIKAIKLDAHMTEYHPGEIANND